MFPSTREEAQPSCFLRTQPWGTGVPLQRVLDSGLQKQKGCPGHPGRNPLYALLRFLGVASKKLGRGLGSGFTSPAAGNEICCKSQSKKPHMHWCPVWGPWRKCNHRNSPWIPKPAWALEPLWELVKCKIPVLLPAKMLVSVSVSVQGHGSPAGAWGHSGPGAGGDSPTVGCA